MQVQLMTYADVVAHAIDYMGGDTTVQTERFARRAVQLAVNDYWSKRTWSYSYKRGRILTTPPFKTGTITYDPATLIVTLAGATWPSWAGEGNIILGAFPTLTPSYPTSAPYPVGSVIDSTHLKLQKQLAANIAITSPSQYTLVQQDYPLPVDFGSAGEVVNMGFARNIFYQTPEQFIAQQRVFIGPANPWMYTIQYDTRRYGSLVLSFYPAPDALYTMDFSYQRQGRALSTHGATPVIAYSAGTASVTDSLTAITGTGTSWTPDMVGCVIRFSGSPNTKPPTGQMGTYPFFIQRTVVGYNSPTSLTLDAVPGSTLANVPYTISDPVDIEAGSMTTYFLREVEKQSRLARRIEPTKTEDLHYQQALRDAFEADARHHEPRSTFSAATSAVRVATLPRGADMGM